MPTITTNFPARCRVCGNVSPAGTEMQFIPGAGKGQKFICLPCKGASNNESKEESDMGGFQSKELDEATARETGRWIGTPQGAARVVSYNPAYASVAVSLHKVGKDGNPCRDTEATFLLHECKTIPGKPGYSCACFAKAESKGETGTEAKQDERKAEAKVEDGAATAATSVASVLEGVIRDAMKNAVDEARVIRIVNEAMAKAERNGPVLTILNGDNKVELNEVTHKDFQTVLRYLSQFITGADGRRIRRALNVYLFSAPGCGKSHMAKQLAKALGLRFEEVQWSSGTPESTVIGVRIPNVNTGGATVLPSPFIECFRDGGLFFGDEQDAADATTNTLLNTALANRRMTLLDGTSIEAHPDFIYLAAGNSTMRGATNGYTARDKQDLAFIDRFLFHKMDYDPRLEQSLCPDAEVREACYAIRRRVREAGIENEYPVTMRFLSDVRVLVEGCGFKIKDAVAQRCAGWSETAKRTAGVTV